MHAVKIRAELMLVYTPDIMSIQVVRWWREKFLLGRQNVNDEKWRGQPSDSTNDENIENVCALLNTYYRYMITEIWNRMDVVTE